MAQGIGDILSGFDRFAGGVHSGVETCIKIVVAALEGWAKAEHGYTDRTTNLTNSIKGLVGQVSPTEATGYLTATMEYAIFVELARNGKWAFLWPVIERHRADILEIISEQLGATARGGGGISPTLRADYEAFKAQS